MASGSFIATRTGRDGGQFIRSWLRSGEGLDGAKPWLKGRFRMDEVPFPTRCRPSTFKTALTKADIATLSLTVGKVALILMTATPAVDQAPTLEVVP